MAGDRSQREVPCRAGLAALFCALHVQAVCQDATVTQELLKEGFHRDLLVKVELGLVGEDAGECAVAVRTRLPPGIYVDPYELASLQQHNLTKVINSFSQKEMPRSIIFLTSRCISQLDQHYRVFCAVCCYFYTQAVLIPDVVDVEAPEYLATDLLVLLYMEPDPWCSHCFRAALPVHGRYHRPAGEREEALVVLKSPEVLVCCCDNRPSTMCWKPAEVEAPCLGKNNSPCQWYSVMHKPAYEESILQVPVGLRQHTSLVCVVTLLATVLCSSLILAAVCKYGCFSVVTCSE